MKIVKLGEVVDLFNGSTPLKTNKDYWVDGDIPWFTVDDLRKQGKYISYTEKFITKLGLKESSISLIPEDAVLLCCTASVGAIAINKIRLTTNQQFNALVIKDPKQLLVEFLYYWFLANMHTLKSLGRATTIDYVSMSKLRDMNLQLPPLEKQKMIVEKLDSAFAEIDLLEENLGSSDIKTQELLQSLLSSAFSSNKAQNDFKKVFTVIPDSKSKIKSSSYLEFGKYAVVDQGKELVAGYTDTSPTVDKKSLPVIVFGDHTRAVKYIDFPFTAGADGIQILKPSALTNPKYGFYLVLHAVGQIPSKGYARHFGELKKMQFQLPSLPEQRKIVEKLDSVFAEIELLKAQIKIEQDQATALRQSLLSNAFTQEKAVA